MKRIIAVASGVALVLGLTACGGKASVTTSTGTNQSSTSTAQVQTQDLQIVESGWSADNNGYVHYGIIVGNPNAGKRAENPIIRITGKDSSGNVLFSDNQYLFGIEPQQQVAFGSQAGNGTTPATVDFELVVKSYGWQDGQPLTGDPFAIANTSETDKGYGMYDFSGMVTNNTTNNYDTVAVTAILRNADGAIVAGYTSYAEGVNSGSSAAFDVNGYELPDFSRVDYFAQPWSVASSK